MEQNVIIDISQDIPLVFMAAIFENRYPNPTGHIRWVLSKIEWMKKKIITLLGKFITLSGSITLLVDFIKLSGSITLSGVYYIIGAK